MEVARLAIASSRTCVQSFVEVHSLATIAPNGCGATKWKPPVGAPRRPQRAPDGPKRAPIGPQGCPRGAQEGSKRAPPRPQPSCWVRAFLGARGRAQRGVQEGSKRGPR
eukprot:3762868-Pyramimonas_sp.AAC.1